MDINIINQIGACQEFMSDPRSKKETVSIIISPLKVTNASESDIRIVSGCNLWQACKNTRCHFSSSARALPKIKRAGD